MVISLSSGTRQSRFTPEDVAQIDAIHKTLSAAVIRNWNLKETAAEQDVDNQVEERLATFGADRLSPREAEVIRLVLQGHSAGSASAFPGITEGTVKVHRHTAYSKLGVSSQAELFSTATRYLASKPS
ncbi:MAG: helix-turn-helix transcriptional regulator [Ruegeria sp.]